MNTKHKVDTVIFSANTPADLKETLSKLKNLSIDWTKIVPLKKGVKATIIIPVIDFKQTPSGMIRLASYKDLFQNTFIFEDGKNLYSDKKMTPNVWLLGPFHTQKFIEYPPQQ
jgi:hypothetical protein